MLRSAENPRELPNLTWGDQVAKAYRRALKKVQRGEWLGVPRKLRREVWRALNGKLRAPDGRRCELSHRAAENLANLMEAARRGDRLR